MTAYADKQTEQRTLLAGFDMWFTKPLNFDEFLGVFGCLASCQPRSYAIAQRILGKVLKDGDLNLENHLSPAVPS